MFWIYNEAIFKQTRNVFLTSAKSIYVYKNYNNSKKFARILFSRKVLRDIIATSKNRDWNIIYSVNISLEETILISYPQLIISSKYA